MDDKSTQSLLEELCHALGWQGGTRHQALDEVKRLVEFEKRARTKDALEYGDEWDCETSPTKHCVFPEGGGDCIYCHLPQERK